MMAAIDPGTFQTAAIAWLGVVTAILIAAITAITTVLRAIKDAQARLNDHSARITNATNRIVDVALATDPNNKPK